MLKKLFADKKRALSSLVILLVIIPAFILTKFGGEPGRIIGLIIYIAIAIIGLFEVFKAVGVGKYIAAVLSLVVVPFVLISWGPFNDFIKIGAGGDNAHEILISSLRDWKGYLIVFMISTLSFADDEFRKNKNLIVRQMIIVLVSFIAVIFAKAIWVLNIESPWKVLFFVGIAVISDTMAYVGGMLFGSKWFGGKKFAPRLSPKKTWAGFLVGFVSAVIFAILVGYFGKIWDPFNTNGRIIISIVAGIILPLISPYGDLLFSAIKRFVGIKDFSNLIPGHGGIFDRIDALSMVLVFGSIFYLLA